MNLGSILDQCLGFRGELSRDVQGCSSCRVGEKSRHNVVSCRHDVMSALCRIVSGSCRPDFLPGNFFFTFTPHVDTSVFDVDYLMMWTSGEIKVLQ